MMKAIKKACVYLRNILLWLIPFFVFCITIFLVVYFLKGNLDKYLEILKILIWPVTVLVGLFFFRKVVTYMFFSMDEFNFFGVKGDLKNVQELINEKVDKRFSEEKKEKEITEKMKEMEEKLNNTSTSDTESRQLVREIYKIYKDSKKESQTKINELMAENQNLRESLSRLNVVEMSTPDKPAEIGSGDKINDQTETEPKKDE